MAGEALSRKGTRPSNYPPLLRGVAWGRQVPREFRQDGLRHQLADLLGESRLAHALDPDSPGNVLDQSASQKAARLGDEIRRKARQGSFTGTLVGERRI